MLKWNECETNGTVMTLWCSLNCSLSIIFKFVEVCVCVTEYRMCALQLCALLSVQCFSLFHVQPKNGFFIPVGLWDLKARLPLSASTPTGKATST